MLQEGILKKMINHLYVHIPFCTCICAYCDFFKVKYNEKMADKWIMAFANEIKYKNINPKLKTIYIGGGTPSALNLEQLEAVLALLYPYSHEIEEYTVECNPESISLEKVLLMKKYNVNRISLGIQSFDNRLQNIMERVCSKEEILQKLQMIYEHGITNISVDFIYGLPTQTLEMWENDLREILKNPYVSHLSLYSLTIEKNTKFFKLGYQPAESELETQMYNLAIQLLTTHHYEQYEIASFAKNKQYSKHNLSYWTYQDFYGLGAGASGKNGNYRYDNERNLLNYFNSDFKFEKIHLSKNDIAFEHLMMNLRLRWGVCLSAFKERHGIDLLQKYPNAIQKLTNKKWLEVTDDTIKTTYEGMFALHDVLVELMMEE